MLVHANILIIGDSSLSISAGYINTHELVLIPDFMSYNNLKICDILFLIIKISQIFNLFHIFSIFISIIYPTVVMY